MKILYLAEWDAFSSSGVLRKIEAQFHEWLSVGADATLLLLSPAPGAGAEPSVGGVRVKVFTHLTGKYGLTKLYKWRAIREIRSFVKDFNPDVIYYRQASWSPGILSVLKSAKCVVVEVNSDDVSEAMHYGFVKGLYFLLTRRLLISSVSGFVCVGDELAESYKGYGKPVCAVANGFDVGSVLPRPLPMNSRPQLVIVGSPGQRWHGFDKLVRAAALYPDFDFHIVGERLDGLPPNVISHGYVRQAELEALYAKMDFGIATLALHRKGMNEASPLKTREYLAYSMPVIGAYRDTDVSGCDFFLELPNVENCLELSVGRIREFVEKWKGRPLNMDVVVERIGSKAKEERRLQFIRSVANGIGEVGK